MADPELVRVMDYILNRCDEKNIEAVAAAVVRRRRDLALFGGMRNLPDPGRMAREISGLFSIDDGMQGLKETIREMAVRIIRQEAPELTDQQVEELTRAWVPGGKVSGTESPGSPDESSGEKRLPPDLLGSMIEQFIAFSTGRMSSGEDKALRSEMGSWPDRYWKAFPQVVQLIIRDFLKGEITEEEFRSKIAIALRLG
ncbi:MAG: hypothetical protein LBP43_01405 [Treponema sp.]|jgi:hypothetical protein|nr:hypothetical protein [Treponema sp.]